MLRTEHNIMLIIVTFVVISSLGKRIDRELTYGNNADALPFMVPLQLTLLTQHPVPSTSKLQVSFYNTTESAIPLSLI